MFGTSYQLMPNPKYQADDPDYKFLVKILEESYNGIVIEYGTLQFAETENSDGTLNMNFNYEIYHTPKDFDKKTLTGDERFNKLVGDIMLDLMDKVYQSATAYAGDNVDVIVVEENEQQN